MVVKSVEEIVWILIFLFTPGVGHHNKVHIASVKTIRFENLTKYAMGKLKTVNIKELIQSESMLTSKLSVGIQ